MSAPTHDELRVQVEETMLLQAYDFGVKYFKNLAKTLKDRTGEKERGFGEIVTANLYGKLAELGVAKILSNLSGKMLKVDMDVDSEFDETKPDVPEITDVDGSKREPRKFIEIKFSPKNYEWIGLYLTQMENMRKHAKKLYPKSSNPDDDIIIINVAIINKKTDDELLDQSSLDAIEESGNEIEKLEEELGKLPRMLGKNTVNKYFPGKNLTDARSELKLKKKKIRDEIRAKNLFIKNLKKTLPQRKQDLLGVYLKHTTEESDLDFFEELDDFEIVIEYATTVSELRKHGKEFSVRKDANGDKLSTDQPSAEIFVGKGVKNVSYVDSDVTGNNYKIIQSEKIDQFTIVPVNLQTQDMKFPEQFGSLCCDGDVEIIQETKNKKVHLYLKCNSQVHVWSEFLGYWDFNAGEIWKLKIVPSWKDKNRDDQFIPKRILDQSVFQKDTLHDRIKKIADEI